VKDNEADVVNQYEKFINWTVTCRNRRLIRQYSELSFYSVILKILMAAIEPSDLSVS
jgi:hypothetical protein